MRRMREMRMREMRRVCRPVWPNTRRIYRVPNHIPNEQVWKYIDTQVEKYSLKYYRELEKEKNKEI